MAQYGQEQYGTVQYGGGTQAKGTANFDFSASGQVTSDQDSGTATFNFSPSGQVTSAFDSGTATFNLTASGVGDVVGRQAAGTANFTFDATGTVTSAADSGTANFNFDAFGVPFPVPPTGTEYYLDRTDRDNYIVFNGDESDYPDITIGEETNFTFYIKGESRFQGADERYDRVKELEKYAGYAQVERTLNSAYYSEPGDYPLIARNSLLVRIEPGDGVENARGIWGIVQSIDDSTEIFGAVARIDMSVFVLAEYDDFADRTAVENEYKADF